MHIVEPGLSDRPGILHVLERSIEDAFAQETLEHRDDEIRDLVGEKAAMYDESLADGGHGIRFLAAKQGQQVIGVISYGPCGTAVRECTGEALAGIGELGTLYVLPEYQNQGIGSALIQALLQQLAREGVEQFCLDGGFKGSQKRWLCKFGAPYVTVPDYWGPGADSMVWLCRVRDHI